MRCSTLRMPDGTTAIVCTAGRRARQCLCGNTATLLCDWKSPTARSPKKTCDCPLGASCATEVGPNKHLCAAHNSQWEARLGRMGNGPP